MTVIGELAVNAVVRTDEVDRGVRSFRAGMSEMKGIAEGTAGALIAIGTSAGVAAYALVRSQGEIADSIDTTSQKLEMGIEKISQYRYGASVAANMLDGQFDSALVRMNTNIGLADQGLGKATSSLSELNLNASELVKMSTEDRLNAIADALQKVERSSDRVRLSEKIFVDGNMALFLAEGREGLKRWADESDRAGATLDDLANQKLAKADDQFHRMNKSIDGAKHALGGVFAPIIGEVADDITNMITQIRGIPQSLDEATAAQNRHAEALAHLAEVKAKANAAFDARAAFGGERDRAVANAAAAEREYQQFKSDKASLGDQVETTRRANEQFGMSDLERAKDDRANHMVNRDLNDALVRELEIREKLEATRKESLAAQEHEQRLQERAASIIEQNLTPLEELQKKLAEISELSAAGKLSPEQAIKAAQAARNGFTAGVGDGAAPQHAPLAALQFGSSAAFRAIRESQEQGKNKIPAEQLAELREANKLTQKVVDKLDALKDPLETAGWN